MPAPSHTVSGDDSPATQHATALTEWMLRGWDEALEKCHQFINDGVPCALPDAPFAAGAKLLGLGWPKPNASLDDTKRWQRSLHLFHRYLDAGHIPLDRTFLGEPWNETADHYKLPLAAASRGSVRIPLEASIELVNRGALAYCDFRPILRAYLNASSSGLGIGLRAAESAPKRPEDAMKMTPEAAYLTFVECRLTNLAASEDPSRLRERFAQLVHAVMSWRIQQVGAVRPDLPVSAPPRRARARL